MPIANEIVNELSAAQTRIWERASSAATDALGIPVLFRDPFTIVSRPADIAFDPADPMAVIEFAFEDDPGSSQALLIPDDLTKTLSGGASDDNEPAALAALESVVRSLCEGITAVRGRPATPFGISARRQASQLPANLYQADELVCVRANASAGGATGTVTWLFDAATARGMLSEPARETPKQPAPPPQRAPELDILLDVPLEVSVELGRVNLLVQEIVELGAGSIIEIDKAAGDPVDVFVNGRQVAKGEVVVIEDNFGVRITEILSPHERVSKLGEAA